MFDKSSNDNWSYHCSKSLDKGRGWPPSNSGWGDLHRHHSSGQEKRPGEKNSPDGLCEPEGRRSGFIPRGNDMSRNGE